MHNSRNFLMSLVLVLLSCFAAAQLAAPDLRCLEVINPSGDLKITWLGPNDPQNQFFGYEIFVANNRLGPYTAVTATPGSIANTQFVHTTTVTNVQSVFVYMRALSGAGGITKSANSDTLQSIFLNINVSIPDAYKLLYNSIHTPPLGSQSGTMSISRLYQSNWSFLANTTQFTYFDTLSLCNKTNSTMLYTVGIADNSGCISGSNWQGGVYNDRHNPYIIYLDSISVLPNGNTVIGWQAAADKDVVKYMIQQQNAAGLNPTIAVVPGYTSTSFVLNDAAANTKTVGVYVQAIDSCGNGGVVDYVPQTMFLTTSYNPCAFTSQLSWTPYKWATINSQPVDELLEYRVYCSEDSGATWKRIGATTDLNFVHNNVAKNKHILYFVRVVNKRKTMTASSNRVGFFSDETKAPKYIYIKSCSVVKKNTVELRITTEQLVPFAHLVVYRATDESVFDSIGTIRYTGSRNYSFVDENVYSDTKTYFYKIRLVDSCFNMRNTSNVTKTILLQVRENPDNVFQRYLSWTAYQGYDAGTKEYEIWRYVNDVSQSELVGITDTNQLQFTDNLEAIATVGARIEYQVKAIENLGNQYAIQERSTSNFGQAYMEPRLFIPNAFVPDGINSTWKPFTQYIENREYNLQIYNRWGQIVFETSDLQAAWNGDNANAGVYAYLISYKAANGEYIQVTGSLTLIR